MHGAISRSSHGFDHSTTKGQRTCMPSSLQSVRPSSKDLVPAAPELYTILTIYECNPGTIWLTEEKSHYSPFIMRE